MQALLSHRKKIWRRSSVPPFKPLKAVNRMTFLELRQAVKNALQATLEEHPSPELVRKNQLSINKHMSALNSWQRVFDLSDESKVGESLDPSVFTSKLLLFHQLLTNEGKSNATIGPLKTQIRYAYDLFLSHFDIESLLATNNFSAVLQALMREHGFGTIKALGLETGINTANICRWLTGIRRPSKSEHIQALERALPASKGRLASILPAGKVNGRTNAELRQKLKETRKPNSYLYKNARLSKIAYRCKFDKYPKLFKELNDLLLYKTSNRSPEGYVRKKKWKVREDGTCGTYRITRGHLSSFFGYLTTSKDAQDPKVRGLGFSSSELSLGLIVKPDLLAGLFDFLSVRSELFNTEMPALSKYPANAKRIMNTVSNLLKPGKGHVWQLHDQFAPQILGSKWTVKKWRDICADTYGKLNDWKSQFTFHKGRDQKPEENDPIYKILELERPLDELKYIARCIREEIDRVKPGSPLIIKLWRDLSMISLLTVWPLREINTKYLELTELKKDEAGKYNLVLDEEKLKNHYSPAVTSINVCLDDPESEGKPVSEIFDKYFELRATLPNAKSPYVFIPVFHRHEGEVSDFLVSPSQLMGKVTQRYGHFGIEIFEQRFRDIVATHFVRNYPLDGVRRAANALFDTEEMIILKYAHKNKKDRSYGVHDAHRELPNEIRSAKVTKSSLANTILQDPATEYVNAMGMKVLKLLTKEKLTANTQGMPSYVREAIWKEIVKATRGSGN
jgi:hypothetical protein